MDLMNKRNLFAFKKHKKYNIIKQKRKEDEKMKKIERELINLSLFLNKKQLIMIMIYQLINIKKLFMKKLNMKNLR